MDYSEAGLAKAQLAKELGHEPREETWEHLVDDGWTSGFGIAPTWLEDALDEYWAFDARFGAAGTQRLDAKADQETPPDETNEFLSDLLASDAARDPRVQRFRSDLLGGQLIAFGDVELWIEKGRTADGPPTPYLHVAVPVGTDLALSTEPLGIVPTPEIRVNCELPAVGQEWEFLECMGPSDQAVRRVPVARGGVLYRLRELSLALAKKYGWQPAAATAFVLTGIPVVVPLARSRLHMNSNFPGLQTVTLTVSAQLSPSDVAKEYARVKREWGESGLIPWSTRGRNRAMTRKHLALAVFAHERRILAGSKWGDLMEAWNSAHADWRYESVPHFARDAEHARRRILGLDRLGVSRLRPPKTRGGET